MRFHQPSQIFHLIGTTQIHGILPKEMRPIYCFMFVRIKLPYIMAAIRIAKSACKHIEVCIFSYVISAAGAEAFYIKTNGMVLIKAFTIYYRFYWLKVIIMLNIIIHGQVPAMPVLKHIKSQPCLLMEPGSRS